MKICPSCRQTYTDDNLNFCLNDGAFLTNEGVSEPKTVYMNPTRVTSPINFEQPTNYEPPAVWQNQSNIQQQQSGYPAMYQSQDKTLPTISMILGIIAVLIGCCYGGIPLGAGAIIVGVVALNNEKSDPTNYGGKSMAIAGIVTGAVGFAISIMIVIGAIFS